MNKRITLLLWIACFTASFSVVSAQPDRWQQHIKYTIDVKMNVVNNRFTGTEKIEYINNSPDTLDKIFIHLYWNAFQPNSEMDIRSRELGKTILTSRRGQEYQDWDPRVRDRINKLTDAEIGYDSVEYVKINGIAQHLVYHETILEVILLKPILPKTKTVLDIAFRCQVPLQVRRSGRDNAEGVRYSMSQWYPKISEYDYQGWNPNPYIAREFYGVWGDYDVKIAIDKAYMVAATGVLQNPNQLGFGYQQPDSVKHTVAKLKPADKLKPETKQQPDLPGINTWNFKGENIHDFVWAADPQFKHISVKVRNDLTLHAFYKAGDAHTDSAWNNILWSATHALPFMEKKFGKYPYPQYSFIQGGDGGMEYAMATLIKSASLGTVFHEWMHSWYQHMLGTNESLFPWMDEGFATFAEGQVSAYYYDSLIMQSPYLSDKIKSSSRVSALNQKSLLPLFQSGSYEGYFALAKSGFEEPLTTHADHYNTNYAYGNAAYSKGAVFITQLGYIAGDSVRDKILLEYYKQWRFKHPNVNDFIRVAEKVSGLQLQWYKEYWVYTTKTIDFAIGAIDVVDGKTQISIKRLGKMPMPVDVLLTFKDGTKELHSIPLDLMFGHKPKETADVIEEKEWRGVAPEYQFNTTHSLKDLKSIEIDPSQRMADTNRANNKLVIPD